MTCIINTLPSVHIPSLIKVHNSIDDSSNLINFDQSQRHVFSAFWENSGG